MAMTVDWDGFGGLSEAAFADAPVGMAITRLEADGSRWIQVANRALAIFLGTTPGDLIGMTFNELTHPDDVTNDDAAATRIRRGTLDVYRHRKRYRHRDGHYRWAELHARALRSVGEATIVLAHIIDIGDLVRLEQETADHAEQLERQVSARTAALERSRSRLRAALEQSQAQREKLELVLDASRAAVGEWNVAEGTLHLSDGWYRLLGYEPGEIDLTSAPWHDLVHPDDHPELLRVAEQLGKASETVLELTFRVRHKDGTWRWNRHRGVITEWDADGRPARILGIDLDVTEQHRLEQQLVHSAKMQSLGAFAGGIAHDFNNVLAIIQGNAEALERASVDGSDAQGERVAAIQRAVQRATSLVRNLMLLNRPTMGVRRPLDLSDFLRRSTGTLPYLLGEDVRLEITVPPHPVTVAIDEGRFEAVLLNLAANARDAMPLGGTLAVELAATAGDRPSATLRVTDTGIGMDHDTLSSVFEPFFTTKAPGVGTGLGLATTYATVTDAHGTITFDSEPDAGTTVTIVLPVTNPIEEARPVTPLVGVSTSPNATLLVVEDEAELLELTTEVLRERGFRVHGALDADEALEILEQHHDIELVITDAVMPGISGPELASIIRRRWPTVKLLLMSGYAANSPMNEHFTDAQLLTKPVSAGELVGAVSDALLCDRMTQQPNDRATERPDN